MRVAKKEGKKFYSRIPFILDLGKKIPKKITKKFKKLKNLFPALFLAKTRCDKPNIKKSLVPNSVHTRPGQENSQKNTKKNQKIKNILPALFLAKTG